MITLRHEFEISSEPPIVYLDHWALRRLSENAALGCRFLDAFSHRGTVAFSLMNVCEIAGTICPETSKQIRDFLEKLGPHWVPMTVDPLPILKGREHRHDH